MAVNKYSQILQGPQFQARSLQEALIAPMALREQHDRTIDAAETNLKEAMKAEVGSEYGEQFQEYLKGYEDETNSIIADINSSGINNNAVLDKFGSMKRRMDKDFSNQGVIGKLVNTNSRVKEANDNAIKLAIEQGQSPDWASTVAKRDRENYYSNMPKNLDEIKGEAPEYRPTLAPKYTDIVKEFTPVYNMLGVISKELSKNNIDTSNYQIVPDANGNPVLMGYDKTKNTTTEIDTSNKENLQKAVDLLWAVQSNENSPLMQNLRYLGHDTENLLETARLLQGVALKENDVTRGTESSEFVQGKGSGKASGSSKGSAKTKEEKEQEEQGDIILKQSTTGSEVSTPEQDNKKINELLSTHPSERTPQMESELNSLLRKKELTDRTINSVFNEKYYKNGKLNKTVVKDDDIKRIKKDYFIKPKANDLDNIFSEFKKETANLSKEKQEELDRTIAIAKEQLMGTSSIPKSDYEKLNVILANTVANVIWDEPSLAKGVGGIPNIYSKLSNDLIMNMATTEMSEKEIARILAEEEVGKLAVANTYETYSVSSLNAASAMKDPQELRRYSDQAINLVLNGAGGGDINYMGSDGKAGKYTLSDKTSREEIQSDLSNAKAVTVTAFDITDSGMVMRINSEHEKDNGNRVVTQYMIPIVTDNSGRIPENVDAVLNRLLSYGSERDAARINTIRDIATSTVQGQPLPEDLTYSGRVDNTNIIERYPNMSVTTKQAAMNYNSNGILMNGRRIPININSIDSEHYPYTRKDLNMVGNFSINIPGKGNYFTTKYQTKDMKKGEYKHMTFGNYIGKQLAKAEVALGEFNEPTREAANIIMMSQMMDAIKGGELSGISPYDQLQLDGIEETITTELGGLAEKYKKLEWENANNPAYKKNKEGIFLTPEQQASKNKELNEVYSSYLGTFDKIKLAAKNKYNLL